MEKTDNWEDNLFNDFVYYSPYAKETFIFHLKGEIERKTQLLQRVEAYLKTEKPQEHQILQLQNEK